MAVFDQFAIDVMSGKRRGFRAACLSALLSGVEPFYSGATTFRNFLFERGIRRSADLGRPVISIGNITTGGTGKTPMVRWLAAKLRDDGHRVAVLSRGYKSAAGQLGDEQIMLDRQLNSPGSAPIHFAAHPSRQHAAADVLSKHPQTNVFILDDGFQHRAARRDLDIVLISAAEPFGFGHVLPRGLLREPLRGLARAGALVMTHADRASDSQLQQIEQTIRTHNSSSPIYRARHAIAGLRSADGSTIELRDQSVFAFCGIANPQLFERQIEAAGAKVAGHQWFADHHRYTPDDLKRLTEAASAARATAMLTTEKDWAKLADLPGIDRTAIPIWRVDIAIEFFGEDEQRLFQYVQRTIENRSPRRHGDTEARS
ncbi:MAG TPA: tetraacyldisaccharide 4'-kinase [Humisphaera sp.]|nr:tetraacyldisaccharide 4'-kinase [Humisphaera sp.]